MPKGYPKPLSEEDIIKMNELYHNDKMGLGEVARLYHIPINRASKIIKNKRTSKEASKIWASKQKFVVSKECRKKISDTMKKTHAEGKHPGWRHINTDKSRRSYPEKVFLDQLIKYKLNEKYTFIEKMPFGKYFLDFALIDLKVDIEIDGVQHTRPESITHDNDRDEFVSSKGWKVYRIAFKEMQENLQKVMNDLVLWLENIYNNDNRIYNIEEIKLSIQTKKYVKKSKEELEKTYAKRRKLHISKEELEEMVKTKSICEIGRLFNVSDAAVRKRCKHYNIILEKYYWQNNILKKKN